MGAGSPNKNDPQKKVGTRKRNMLQNFFRHQPMIRRRSTVDLIGRISTSVRVFSSDRRDERQDSTRRRQRPSRSRSRSRGVDTHYDILGIPRNSSPEAVKRAFLQLALRHHPDTSADKQRGTDNFVKIREAFEGIKEDFSTRNLDGKDEVPSWFTEEEFDAWFHEETGQRMDSSMRREVMHVYRSGLTRTEYGAVWEIAFVLEEEGFFTKKETTLPNGGTKSNDDNCNAEKASRKSRRKRNF